MNTILEGEFCFSENWPKFMNTLLAFIPFDFLIVYSIVIEANFPDSQFDILYRTY